MTDRSNPEALAVREQRRKDIAELEAEEMRLERDRCKFEAQRVTGLVEGRKVVAELDDVRARLGGMRRSLGEPA